MGKSQVFLYFCLFFLAGIFINSLFPIPQIFLWGVSISGIILISVFWRDWKFVIIGFCVLFFVLGIWRYQAAESGIKNQELGAFNDLEKEVILSGYVIEEPDTRADKIKLKIKNEELKINNEQQIIPGNILVTTNRYPEYQYGDRLEIMGKLQTPKEFPDFNYKEYLAKSGIFSVMYYPEIKILSRNEGNLVYKILFAFRNKVKENLRKIIRPSEEGILEALLFGDESNISEGWKTKLNISGTRHITAVSGMNITIIANLLMGFLIAIGFWRQQAFYIAVAILILYIMMIGAPASAVRAGIMAGLMLLAMQVGRLNQAWRAIIFAATIMAAINPMLLRFDVGFQLSFLAVLGMIFLQPYFQQKFQKIPKFLSLRGTISTTLAAQIFTLPILLYNFGRIPIWGLAANILIVPLLPAITIFGFILGLAGLIFIPFAQILSWPLWLILTYLTSIIDGISRLPLSTLAIKNVHWLWLVIGYIIIAYLIWRIRKKSRPEPTLEIGGDV